uniref:Uncharacterized protein n=1 Tax=Timema poppense TaxID=170557 RepID=A0A7R9DJJ3_TIMPO|nr:unnamed protein product [Timema poppensis]
MSPPLFQRHSHLFNSVCTLKGGHYYIVTLLALVGWVVALADVLRLLLGGPTLVDELLRRRRAVHIRLGKWMTSRPVLQKDIKLIASVLAIEHYTFLIAGVFIANPSLFLPYLMMQAFMVLVQGVVFIIMVIDCGVHLSRMELLYSGE